MSTTTLITRHADFVDLCQEIKEAGLVAFDTEFISDGRYRPELGLLQFATRDTCIAVDPLEIGDTSLWWEIMADDETDIVIHGGQAEIRFCIEFTGRPPRRTYDLQIAEGLLTRTYPISYTNLVQRTLDIRLQGNQTRTDWLRRPLSPEQLHYALEDVSHVLEIRDRQLSQLERLGRLAWVVEECQRQVDYIVAEERAEPVTRIQGIHKLSRRQQAVARELSQWREDTARTQNKPTRRLLRDDLLIDIAKRQPGNGRSLTASQELNRPWFRRHVDDVLECISNAREIPDEKLPEAIPARRRDPSDDDKVVSRLLGLALGNLCADLEIAQPLAANSSDLASLVRYQRRAASRRPLKDIPQMLTGWRRDAFGETLLEVLNGNVWFAVAPPNSETPLIFERRTNSVDS